MGSRLRATFIPSQDDGYYMPEVVAPLPQRVTPQVPKNMQDDLQRLELEAHHSELLLQQLSEPTANADSSRAPAKPDKIPEIIPRSQADTRAPQLRTNDWRAQQPQQQQQQQQQHQSQLNHHHLHPHSNHHQQQKHQRYHYQLQNHPADTMGWDEPSFSPFPKIQGDNVPPADDEKEKILWKARDHVLHSHNISMQITWARDVLIWAEISSDAATREATVKDTGRPSTPRIEHELRIDALNIIRHLASQEHPDALYIRAKWLEFGKFGERMDKREAYAGYKLAAELGHPRSEYRMGMLFEQSNDMPKAKEHYYKGLSLRDSASQYRLGMISLLGQHGESKDYQAGLERIRNAAEGADEDAPQGAYVYGMLIARDLPDITIPEGLLSLSIESAKMYVEKAAYLGFAKAQLKMGQAYELCQLGCDFNPSYSLHYYGLAAKQGIPEAALGVSRWFLFGYEGVFKKNEELAFKYAHEAASAKLGNGEFAVGYYHEIGIHVNKSIPEARKWYQLAADHGNQDAIGRLESLSQDRSLSKQDHETTTHTRIKSQHGSQRGKRPDRFNQPAQPMPTLSEGSKPSTPVNESGLARPPLAPAASAGQSPRVSPGPSPGMRPNIVTEHPNIPDPSRASLVSSNNPSAFNIRLDTEGFGQPLRGLASAPYPDDDRPQPLSVRSKSTAPYPEDDTRLRHNPNFASGQGPQADREGSAFGINTGTGPGGQRIMPSQSAGNLYPSSHNNPNAAGRGRAASAGWDPQGPGNFHQGSGPNNGPGRPYPGDGRPGGGPGRMQNQPPGGRPFGGPQNGPRPQGGIPLAGTDPGRDYPSRPGTEAGNDRYQRSPSGQGGPGGPGGPMGPGSDPRQARPQTSHGSGGPSPQGPGGAPRPLANRVGTAPIAQSSSPGPNMDATSSGKAGKGPATFEDMGIPQGKQDGECLVM